MEQFTWSCALRSPCSPGSLGCVDSCIWFAHLSVTLFAHSLLLSLQKESSLLELSPHFSRVYQISSEESSFYEANRRATNFPPLWPHQTHEQQSRCLCILRKQHPASLDFHLCDNSPYRQSKYEQAHPAPDLRVIY